MNFKEDYLLFEEEIAKRKIKYLIHFTPTINLYSILENKKIMSRAKLENLDIEQFDILDYIKFSDNIRYDDKNYINLSISSPNTFLFSKFQSNSKDNPEINWCVLKINNKYIYENSTLFSVVNAASYSAKNQFGISKDFNAFKNMFMKEVTYNNRCFNRVKYNLKDKYPTDIQAEVLVKDIIHSDDIIEVCFKNEEDLAQAKAAMNEFNTNNFIVDNKIFKPIREK
ncbi:MAG: DarT ssDNA thymidine ADP-ribosyltransferase family protein [Sulfurimonas sp.]